MRPVGKQPKYKSQNIKLIFPITNLEFLSCLLFVSFAANQAIIIANYHKYPIRCNWKLKITFKLSELNILHVAKSTVVNDLF